MAFMQTSVLLYSIAVVSILGSNLQLESQSGTAVLYHLFWLGVSLEKQASFSADMQATASGVVKYIQCHPYTYELGASGSQAHRHSIGAARSMEDVSCCC